MECLLNEILIDFFLLFISVFLNKELEMMVWIVSFTLLRWNLGGYHAKTRRGCVLASVITAIVSVEIAVTMIQFPKILSVIAWLNLGIVVLISAVKYIKRRILEKKRKEGRKKAILISGIETICVWIGAMYRVYYFMIVSWEYFLAVLLGIIGKLKYKTLKM